MQITNFMLIFVFMVVIDKQNILESKKFSQLISYEANPFWHLLFEGESQFRIIHKPNRKKLKMNDEFNNHAWTGIQFDAAPTILDLQKFVKVFQSSFEDMKVLANPSGMLLWYIMSVLKEKQDEMRFDIGLYMEWAGIGSKTVAYKALFKLCQMEFIAKKKGSRGYLFINPYKFFNGNRAKHEVAGEEIEKLKKRLYDEWMLKKQADDNGTA